MTPTSQHRSILVAADYYTPGYRAGGPIRTLSSMVDRLSEDLGFQVITRDHDLGDPTPYPGILPGEWNEVGGARVYYCDRRELTTRHLGRLACSTGFDCLYLNSVFSPRFTIAFLWLRHRRVIPDRRVVLAPRGELSPSALALGRRRKRAYLAIARRLGLYDNVLWQAASTVEEHQIRALFPSAKVTVAPDVSPRPMPDGLQHRRPKIAGQLRVVFVGRVASLKNLSFALSSLQGLRGELDFTIYGPIEDQRYWARCRRIIATLSPNVKVSVVGATPHDDIRRALSERDLFFLPSLSESFGHAILEALLAGCPVLTSDRTPWQGLEHVDAGWNCPLERPDRFKEILQMCIDASPSDWAARSAAAHHYALARSLDPDPVARNHRLFEST